MGLKKGTWKEKEKALVCPYCNKKFQPRAFSDLTLKQCPHCHRYFLLPKELVVKIIRDERNIGILKVEMRRMGLEVDKKTDRELQNYITELIENNKVYWDAKGWFFTLKRGDLE